MERSGSPVDGSLKIPPETEAQLGETVFEQIASEKNVIDDPLIVEKLDRLAEPLIQAIDSDRYGSTTIIEDESINAFALPGGYAAYSHGLDSQSRSARKKYSGSWPMNWPM